MPANKRIESDRQTRCAASPAPHPGRYRAKTKLGVSYRVQVPVG